MERVSLQYGNTHAEVQLCGAQICSFHGADGREVIWQADPAVWAQHAPILFPICGSVKDDHVKIDGKVYPMRKHGFTRAADFCIGKHGTDFVELVFDANADTKQAYPFDFAFHVTYSLFAEGYTTTFLVENRSQETMPFCVGGHPAFICPMEPGAAFEDYQLIFPLKEDGRIALAPTGKLIEGWTHLPDFHHARTLHLRHALFDEHDALLFTELQSRSVKLVHRDSGKGLQFDFPKMEVFAVWTKPHANADYLCLEPWHGMPECVGESGNLEDKPFVTLLPAGQCYKTWFTVTLI